MEERLQKYLAMAGVGSRRYCETLISERRVMVNGQTVDKQGVKVDPAVDSIQVDGKSITMEEEYVYIMLNKPSGYVTTVKDPQGRPTVLDLLQDVSVRLYPVGRLDYETEGLLLLTNDGEFAYRMTHPKFKMSKIYLATVQGQLSDEKIERLRTGVKLDDGMTKPAKVNVVRKEKYKTVVEMGISEGKNRQVRRMFKAVGNPVLALKRISIDQLTLDKLSVGSYRYLNKEELAGMCYKMQLGDRLEKMAQTN